MAGSAKPQCGLRLLVQLSDGGGRDLVAPEGLR